MFWYRELLTWLPGRKPLHARQSILFYLVTFPNDDEFIVYLEPTWSQTKWILVDYNRNFRNETLKPVIRKKDWFSCKKAYSWWGLTSPSLASGRCYVAHWPWPLFGVTKIYNLLTSREHKLWLLHRSMYKSLCIHLHTNSSFHTQIVAQSADENVTDDWNSWAPSARSVNTKFFLLFFCGLKILLR